MASSKYIWGQFEIANLDRSSSPVQDESPTDDGIYREGRASLCERFYKWKESVFDRRINLQKSIVVSNELVTPSFSYTILNPMSVVGIRTVMRSVDRTLEGRFFVCRFIVDPFQDGTLIGVVEDPFGDLIVSLVIINCPYPSFTCTIGTTLVIKDPCFKRNKSQCYVVNYGNVIILTKEQARARLPNLKWSSFKPTDTDEDSNSSNPSISESIQNYLDEGDDFFDKFDYNSAIEAYSYGLNLSPESVMFLIPRCLCLFAAKKYKLALDDSLVALEQFPDDPEFIIRVVYPMNKLGRFEDSKELLESKLSERHSDDLQTLLTRTENLIAQRDYGRFDMNILFQNIASGKHLEMSDYVGPIEVKDVGRLGRGVILTEDVSPGTLLMSCQALVSVALPKSDINEALFMLINALALQIEAHPVGGVIYNLSAGKEMGYLDPNKDDCSIVDIERLRRIVLINASENYLLNDGRLYGLWILPSYINHDCHDGNCFVSLYGNVRQIRSSRLLKKGEELFISYREIGDSLSSRIQAAYMQDFICACSLCLYEVNEPKDSRQKREQILENFRNKPIRPISELKAILKHLKQLSIKSPFADQYLYGPLVYLGGIYYKNGDWPSAIKMYSEFLAKWERSGGDVSDYLVRASVCGYLCYDNMDDIDNCAIWKEVVYNHVKMVYGCTDDDFLETICSGITLSFKNLDERLNLRKSKSVPKDTDECLGLSALKDEDTVETFNREAVAKGKNRRPKKSNRRKSIEKNVIPKDNNETISPKGANELMNQKSDIPNFAKELANPKDDSKSNNLKSIKKSKTLKQAKESPNLGAIEQSASANFATVKDSPSSQATQEQIDLKADRETVLDICTRAAEKSLVINATETKDNVFSQSESMILLKRQANECFVNGQYIRAVNLYTTGLELKAEDEEFLANRALCHLRLENYELALIDSLEFLKLNPVHVKAFYRVAKAYIGLKAYDKAVALLEASDLLVPNNKDLTKLLSVTKELLAQSEYGHYDFKMFYARFAKAAFYSIADYSCPVEIKDVGVKGRGIVVTRDVQPGELLICCQAFAIHFVPKSEVLVIKREEGVNHLVTLIVQKLTKNSKHGRDLYQLWAGSQMGYLDPAKDDCGEIDIPRIKEIIKYNGSEEDLLDSRRFSLFILPSYINNDCHNVNCTLLYFGNVCQIRSTKFLKKGQEVLYQYSFRRGPSRINFSCQCDMCLYESSEPEDILRRRQALVDKIMDKQFHCTEELQDIITNIKELSIGSPFKDFYIAVGLFELGNMFYQQRNYDQVIEVYNELLIDWQRFGGDFGRIFATASQQMLTIYFKRNDSKKARKWKKEYKKHVRQIFGCTDIFYMNITLPGFGDLEGILKS